MDCTLADIEKVCDYAGGLRIIRYFPRAVKLPADYGEGRTYGDIELPEPADTHIYTIYPRKRTARLRWKQGDGKAGQFFTWTLTFTVPKQRTEVAKTISSLHNRRVHFIVTDENGNNILLLNMKRDIEGDTGRAKKDVNNYAFSFSNRAEYLPPFFNGMLTDRNGMEIDLSNN